VYVEHYLRPTLNFNADQQQEHVVKPKDGLFKKKKKIPHPLPTVLWKRDYEEPENRTGYVQDKYRSEATVLP